MNRNHQPNGDEAFEARLTAYALGQLDEHDRKAVEAELAGSEKAQEQVRVAQVLGNYVYQATCRDVEFQPSASLRDAIEKRLDELEMAAETSAVPPLPSSRLGWSRRRFWAILAVAACLLIAIVPLSRGWLAMPSGEPQLALEERAADGVAASKEDAERSPGREEAAKTSAPAPSAPLAAMATRAERRDMPAAKAEMPVETKPALAPAAAAPAAPPAQTYADHASPAPPRPAERPLAESSPASASSPASVSGQKEISRYSFDTRGAAGNMPSPEAAKKDELAAPNSAPADAKMKAQDSPAGPAGAAELDGMNLTMPAKSGEGLAPSEPMGFGNAMGQSDGEVRQQPASPSSRTRTIKSANSGEARQTGRAAELAKRRSGVTNGSGMGGMGGSPGAGGYSGSGEKSRAGGYPGMLGGYPGMGGMGAMGSQSAYGGGMKPNAAKAPTVGKPAAKAVPGPDMYAKESRSYSGDPGGAPALTGSETTIGAQDRLAELARGRSNIQQQFEEKKEVTELSASVAPGTERYDQVIENAFQSARRHPLSTFSIDVDTASYSNVRRFLRQGQLPPPDAVRIEEMVNYFRYHYEPPKGEEPFAVNMEVAGCPWNEGHRLVRIGMKGREIDRRQRGPSNLVFLLDVSGSMDESNKLPLVKNAMKALAGQLGEDDRVAIVTYASGTEVRLESTNAGNKQKILDTIESLRAGGSTNGGAGIQLAYEQAAKNFRKDGSNRVILATDGDLNVGVTDDDQLVRLIQEKAKTGVFLTVLGVGTGNLQDGKLEKLADKGNGTYAYLDDEREAQRVLVDQMSGSLVTIAKDVKLQVEFNPAEVESYRLIGYENRRMAARDFHNDAKDAGEIGAGHTVTALYEVVPGRSGDAAMVEGQALKYQRVAKADLTDAANNGELLTLRLRYKPPKEDQSKLQEYALKNSGKRFGQATADFQFAAAVASFGMILRDSQYRGSATLKAVEEIASSTLGDDPGGYRAEFLDLVRRTEQLRGQK